MPHSQSLNRHWYYNKITIVSIMVTVITGCAYSVDIPSLDKNIIFDQFPGSAYHHIPDTMAAGMKKELENIFRLPRPVDYVMNFLIKNKCKFSATPESGVLLCEYINYRGMESNVVFGIQGFCLTNHWEVKLLTKDKFVKNIDVIVSVNPPGHHGECVY